MAPQCGQKWALAREHFIITGMALTCRLLGQVVSLVGYSVFSRLIFCFHQMGDPLRLTILLFGIPNWPYSIFFGSILIFYVYNQVYLEISNSPHNMCKQDKKLTLDVEVHFREL